MNIMYDLFPNFCCSCDNDEDEGYLHNTSQDVDNSVQLQDEVQV